MDEKKPQANPMPDPARRGAILKVPDGVVGERRRTIDPKGMVTDPAQTLFDAQMAIPDLYEEIIEKLENIDSSLSMIALYFEKKGLADGLLSPDDFEDGEKPARCAQQESGVDDDRTPQTA